MICSELFLNFALICSDIYLAMTDTGRPQKRRVATVGTFDGLHKGHQKVISTVKREAREREMEPLIISFDRHPLETIAPERAPRLIQWPSERTNALYRDGLTLLTLEFTPTLASMTAAQWLRKMHDEHGVDVLVVGYDNTFGSDGTTMKLSDYRRLGEETGVTVIEAPYEPRAASSAIRRLVAAGEIEEAAKLLGRPFSLTGEVVGGKHIGATLGFPTANIRPIYKAVMPGGGVYAVDVILPDGSRKPAVANIGTQPTVASEAPERLEVHIPNFSGDLYGRRLTVSFLRRLRDEKKFDDVEQLKRRIKADIEETLNPPSPNRDN